MGSLCALIDGQVSPEIMAGPKAEYEQQAERHTKQCYGQMIFPLT
jgi:hypothetical protein